MNVSKLIVSSAADGKTKFFNNLPKEQAEQIIKKTLFKDNFMYLNDTNGNQRKLQKHFSLKRLYEIFGLPFFKTNK